MKGLRADFEEKLASENGREWMEGFKLFLKRQNPWEVAVKGVTTIIQKVTDLLKLVKEVAVGATDQKKVSELFIGKRYYYRDPNVDSWLPKMSPAAGEGKLSVYQLEKEMKFKEVALAILGIDDSLASGVDVARGLIEDRRTTAPAQIQNLIERTDAGEDTGLRTDGWGNFFFVENKEGGVSVVRVGRSGDGRWSVGVRRLDYGGRWRVESRFFSRN